MLLILNQ